MKSKTGIYEYIIVGAGPAGLQLGYFLQKENRDFLILEQNDVAGSFYQKFPRHGNLISVNKVYTGSEDYETNMRYDWNSLICDSPDLRMKNYSKEYFPKPEKLVQYLNDFANVYALPIEYNTEITSIDKPDHFVLKDKEGKVFQCKVLIMATGWNKPYIPDIPGIEHGTHYTSISTNKEDYANKRLLIVGKGNSAFETADHLINATVITHISSPKTLSMAWNTHYVGHLRAVNNNFLDTYHLKSQNAVLDADINYIRKVGDQYYVSFSYNNRSGEEEELVYDKIILCTGFRFDDTAFGASIKPKLAIKDRFPDQTCEYESVNIPDLYYAGTITHMRDYQKQASGFIHGFRYNAQVLCAILANKYHEQGHPVDQFLWEPMTFCNKIIERINGSSALWQQYGYLGDIAIVKNEERVDYYQNLPLDYAHEKLAAQQEHYYTITLEYGEKTADAGDHNSVNRVHRDDYQNAHLSKFLHPVVRCFSAGKLVEVHHIIEDLEAVWKEPIHINPLLEFIRSHSLVSS